MPRDRSDAGAARGVLAHRGLAVLFALVLAVGLLCPPVAAAEDYPADIDEDLHLEAAGNQTVTGTSTLDAGTEVTVRIRSSGENPFLMQRQVAIREDGTFAATFDLSSVPPGSEYTAVVVGDDGELSEPVSGTIREPGTEVSTVGMETNVRVAAGETARLNVSMPASGSVELKIGDENEVGYQVTVALYDRDDDGEVGLLFDTAAAGTAESTVSVTDGDGYEIVRPETSLDSPLEAGDYPLRLYENTDDGDPVTLGQLVVTDEGAGESAESADSSEQESEADYTDRWWHEAAPGIAGAVALITGLLSLRFYQG
ncbi:BGTF surface domain-containing protein [Natronomonas sp.]|uniref:BGTF surface domain-containing protein n=1 Tax=Natronomonas sp. TaxID=2184060 RepID=UPI002FC35678